ncbi:MAG TPA: hypothetical protein VKS20_06390, partial [Candidatus Acidoferrales bacterium]|nr:hypothetical protein [Candidatus Acidoferrales bacterium]
SKLVRVGPHASLDKLTNEYDFLSVFQRVASKISLRILHDVLGVSSATLPLPDYGRVARQPESEGQPLQMASAITRSR